jgi:hypothetical protein
MLARILRVLPGLGRMLLSISVVFLSMRLCSGTILISLLADITVQTAQ